MRLRSTSSWLGSGRIPTLICFILAGFWTCCIFNLLHPRWLLGAFRLQFASSWLASGIPASICFILAGFLARSSFDPAISETRRDTKAEKRRQGKQDTASEAKQDERAKGIKQSDHINTIRTKLVNQDLQIKTERCETSRARRME